MFKNLIGKISLQIEYWKTGRHPKFRVNDLEKKRIIDFCRLLLPQCKSLYLGGSQSKFNKKHPMKSSDIDLYVFIDTGGVIQFDEISSKNFTLSLGSKIQIFFVHNKFKDPIVIGMEKLF